MPLKDEAARAEYNRLYRERTDHAGQERKRYQDNPGYRERQKLYRKDNLAKYAELQREWRSNNPRDVMVINARVRAKKKGYPCTITVADLEWPTHCPILGLELDYSTTPTGQRKNAKRDAFPTLDKRDPALGYVPGNVFVISYKANRLKSDTTLDQMRVLLRYVEAGL